jgi:hypothetical protein
MRAAARSLLGLFTLGACWLVEPLSVAWADDGPEERRLQQLRSKPELTADERTELVALATKGGYRSVDVNRRHEALELLERGPITAAMADRLAERLAVTGGEAEDFLRVRIPALIERSGTKNFTTHLALARQISAGGSPTLMRASLSALARLEPKDELVSELLAATALNANHRVEFRRQALELAAAMPSFPGTERTYLEGVLLQAAKDPDLKDIAIRELRERPLSQETQNQLLRASIFADRADQSVAESVVNARRDLVLEPSTPATGRFADGESCHRYLGGIVDVVYYRRALR